MNEDYDSVLKKVEMLEESGQLKMALMKLMHYLSGKAKRFMTELGRPYTNGQFVPTMQQALDVLKGGVQGEESQGKIRKAGDWLVHVQKNFSAGVFDLALKYTKHVGDLIDGLLGMADEIRQRQQNVLLKEMVLQIAEPGRKFEQNFVQLVKNMGILPVDYQVPTIKDDEAIKSKRRSSQRFASVWILELLLVAIWSALGFTDTIYNIIASLITCCVLFVLFKIQGTNYWNKNIVMFSFRFKPKKRAIFLVIYLILLSFFPLIEFKTDANILIPESTISFNLATLLDPVNDQFLKYYDYMIYLKWFYILLIASIAIHILYAFTFSKKDEAEGSKKLKKLKLLNWLVLIVNFSLLVCIMIHSIEDLHLFVPLSDSGGYGHANCDIIYFHAAFYIMLILPVLVA